MEVKVGNKMKKKGVKNWHPKKLYCGTMLVNTSLKLNKKM
jgi:hypothetical protein